MVFEWGKQFKVGQDGENFLLEKYPELFSRKDLDGRKGDIYYTPANLVVEVKTDTYVSDNFFMERYGDEDKQKPGGPWKAHDDGAPVYLYFFKNMNKFYIFDCMTLKARLERLIEDGTLNSKHKRSILNRGWKAMGYKVKIDLLSDICSEIKI